MDTQLQKSSYFQSVFTLEDTIGSLHVRRQRQDDGYQYNVINPVAQKNE
jgi:hypothetical protein